MISSLPRVIEHTRTLDLSVNIFVLFFFLIYITVPSISTCFQPGDYVFFCRTYLPNYFEQRQWTKLDKTRLALRNIYCSPITKERNWESFFFFQVTLVKKLFKEIVSLGSLGLLGSRQERYIARMHYKL